MWVWIVWSFIPWGNHLESWIVPKDILAFPSVVELALTGEWQEDNSLNISDKRNTRRQDWNSSQNGSALSWSCTRYAMSSSLVPFLLLNLAFLQISQTCLLQLKLITRRLRLNLQMEDNIRPWAAYPSNLSLGNTVLQRLLNSLSISLLFRLQPVVCAKKKVGIDFT